MCRSRRPPRVKMPFLTASSYAADSRDERRYRRPPKPEEAASYFRHQWQSGTSVVRRSRHDGRSEPGLATTALVRDPDVVGLCRVGRTGRAYGRLVVDSCCRIRAHQCRSLVAWRTTTRDAFRQWPLPHLGGVINIRGNQRMGLSVHGYEGASWRTAGNGGWVSLATSMGPV